MAVGNLAAIKRQARQDIHNAAAVAVQYSDSVVTVPVTLGARWHSAKVLGDVGNLEGAGYATVLEAIDSVVFDIGEVQAQGLTLRRTGQVFFPDYDLTFTLMRLRPSDGPVNHAWDVARVGQE